MNRSKQYINTLRAVGLGFQVSISRRWMVLAIAIIFPVLVVLFLSAGSGAII
jgi:hypothetical protein